jgi:hypothetical protein
MRLYRNDDMTAEVQWAGTQEEANKAFGRGRWTLAEVPTDKPNLLQWLNDDAFDRRATHTPPRVDGEPWQSAADLAGGAPEPRSIQLEDAWAGLPLATQLHYASLALERAREEVRS